MSARAYDVVESYRARAAWACAESRPTTPHLLFRALGDITTVVEFPAGPGHFLTAYARAGVRVRLIDASRPMLTAATHHARDVGVVELAIGCHFLEHLPDLAEELVVVPNAALNQLAAQTPLTDVLAHLREAVRPGTRLLLQYLQVGPTSHSEPGGRFYDPALPDGHTSTDHTFTDPHNRRVRRHHRQYHTADRSQVRIEFTYTTPGHQERTTHVHLALPDMAEVESALTATGWTRSHTHTHAGFREILANAGDSR
ncbi:class I SAM-dependent methyltransferase [Nocardiopsis alba]|uniref:class I SAM-dependent methyltransferase n=1 Tax=Nocardiopsis alba TaxID=53437 RepID=UPI003672EEB0